MSMILALSPEENRNRLYGGTMASGEPDEPGALKGTAYGVGMGLMRGGARTVQTIGVLGGGLVAHDFGTAAGDQWFRTVDDIAKSAIDHWTPNAGTVGVAGQVLGGLAEIGAPLAVTGGNPALMIANQQVGTSVDLVNKGVDSNAALNTGFVGGVSAAAGFKVAGIGSNVWERMATGAAGNLGVNTVATATERGILNATGNKEAAKDFDPTDPIARGADVVIGAAFGAFQGGKPRIPTKKLDAALTIKNNESYLNAQPGRPRDMASDVASQNAIADALTALNDGELVNTSKSTAGASWDLNPKAAAMKALVEGTARDAGVNPDLALTIASIESGTSPTAKNPNSTASGIFQVLDSTWKEYGGTPENRNNPQVQAEIGAKIIADYTNKLETALGRPVESHEVYLAHLLGPKGAETVLRADPNAPILDVIKGYDAKNADAIVNNNGMRNLTVGEAIDKWRGRVERAQEQVAIAGAQKPAAPIEAPARPLWTAELDRELTTRLTEASELTKRAEADPTNEPLQHLAEEARNHSEDMLQAKQAAMEPQAAEAPKADVLEVGKPAASEVAYKELTNSDGSTRVFDSEKQAADFYGRKKGYEPFDTGDGWILRKEDVLTPAQQRARALQERNARTVDTAKDNLYAAVAKEGGMDKAEVVSTWGSDPKDVRASGVFGRPVLRNKNGLSIDEMAQRMGEHGYLPKDEHGKVDVRDFEEAFAKGDTHYAAQGHEANAERAQENYERMLVQRMMDESPDMVVRNEDGKYVSMKDAGQGIEELSQRAKQDSSAFEAAINCMIGG